MRPGEPKERCWVVRNDLHFAQRQHLRKRTTTMSDELTEARTPAHQSEVSPTKKENRTLVSVDLPNGASGREGSPTLNLVRSGGQIRLVISGLDLTNFEEVVGPKSAQRYREYVAARRSRGVDAGRTIRSPANKHSRGA